LTAVRSLFVSHGSPTLIVDDCPARDFLVGLGATIERPTAILCISAHWETEVPTVSAAPHPETIHDFYGFPDPLYRLRYAPPGAPELAARVLELLGESGFSGALDPARGLDHGAWAPLKLVYPDADIPVTQLSIQHQLGPAHHLRVGQALAPLRDEGVLVLASGSLTHNLQEVMTEFRADRPGAPAPAWAREFDQWVDTTITEGRSTELAAYRERAPYAARAHPRDEHLLPLLVAAGVGGARGGRRLHASFTFGSLSMGAFAFPE